LLFLFLKKFFFKKIQKNFFFLIFGAANERGGVGVELGDPDAVENRTDLVG
jgi:hypothetical protein